ncbi:MAG: DmsE family decaheme c-type cytochrome [Acidobacteriota bacterium]
MRLTKLIKSLLVCTSVLGLVVWFASTRSSQAVGPRDANPRPISATPQGSDYIGSDACKDCHEQQSNNFSHTVHAKVQTAGYWKDKTTGCESCHGPGKAHAAEGDPAKIKNPGKMKPDEVSATCQMCHSQMNEHAMWRGSKHESAGLSCISCHSSHATRPAFNPGTVFANVTTETKLLKGRTEAETCYQCHGDMRKAQFQRSTHLFRNEDREMRVSCSSCHEPHGSIGPKMMRTGSVNETCYTCHAEKRGPFLWEHSPTRENCATCHKPHGSNNTNLLVSRAPMLCQQCHIQGRHQTIPSRPNSGFVMNRACLDCHPQVHGSNHPSGINLQR